MNMLKTAQDEEENGGVNGFVNRLMMRTFWDEKRIKPDLTAG